MSAYELDPAREPTAFDIGKLLGQTREHSIMAAIQHIPPAAVVHLSAVKYHQQRERDRYVLANSRSQWAEDLMLLPYLLRAADWGVGSFVELGALDGVTFSNTAVLERCFNWTGLLIEASPANFAALLRSRRKAATSFSAVCRPDEAGGRVNMTLGGGNVAMQLDAASPALRRRHHGRLREASRRTIAVPCRPLSTLMADVGMHRATFLSLDVRTLCSCRMIARPDSVIPLLTCVRLTAGEVL